MALHLNLHHEIAKQRALQRRDPLKLSAFGLAAVALGFAGYYALQLTTASSLSGELAGVKSEYEGLKGKQVAAQIREQELSSSVKASESLVTFVENRFYWGSVLETLTETVPPVIQITKLAGDVADDKARHCKITIEGISAGAEPRKIAEELRKALGEKFAGKYKSVDAKFGSLDDGKDTASVGGQQLPTAVFAINLQMQIVADEPVAAPVVPRRAPAGKNEGGML
jgi:hypothetical protein